MPREHCERQEAKPVGFSYRRDRCCGGRGRRDRVCGDASSGREPDAGARAHHGGNAAAAVGAGQDAYVVRILRARHGQGVSGCVRAALPGAAPRRALRAVPHPLRGHRADGRRREQRHPGHAGTAREDRRDAEPRRSGHVRRPDRVRVRRSAPDVAHRRSQRAQVVGRASAGRERSPRTTGSNAPATASSPAGPGGGSRADCYRAASCRCRRDGDAAQRRRLHRGERRRAEISGWSSGETVSVCAADTAFTLTVGDVVVHAAVERHRNDAARGDLRISAARLHRAGVRRRRDHLHHLRGKCASERARVREPFGREDDGDQRVPFRAQIGRAARFGRRHRARRHGHALDRAQDLRSRTRRIGTRSTRSPRSRRANRAGA